MGQTTAARLINCTIADNQALYSPRTSGLYLLSNARVEIKGGIFWGNGGTGDPQIWNPGDVLPASYCILENGLPPRISDGGGNLFSDPHFVDPRKDDYHILSSSLAINAGDPSYQPDPGESDIDGQRRVLGGRLDIGADEVRPVQQLNRPSSLR